MYDFCSYFLEKVWQGEHGGPPSSAGRTRMTRWWTASEAVALQKQEDLLRCGGQRRSTGNRTRRTACTKPSMASMCEGSTSSALGNGKKRMVAKAARTESGEGEVLRCDGRRLSSCTHSSIDNIATSSRHPSSK